MFMILKNSARNCSLRRPSPSSGMSLKTETSKLVCDGPVTTLRPVFPKSETRGIAKAAVLIRRCGSSAAGSGEAVGEIDRGGGEGSARACSELGSLTLAQAPGGRQSGEFIRKAKAFVVDLGIRVRAMGILCFGGGM